MECKYFKTNKSLKNTLNNFLAYYRNRIGIDYSLMGKANRGWLNFPIEDIMFKPALDY